MILCPFCGRRLRDSWLFATPINKTRIKTLICHSREGGNQIAYKLIIGLGNPGKTYSRTRQIWALLCDTSWLKEEGVPDEL